MRYVHFHRGSLENSKIEPKYITGFQPQTQSTSVTLNPTTNKTETTGSVSPTNVTGISIHTSSARVQCITIPLQVPTKAIRSNPYFHY